MPKRKRHFVYCKKGLHLMSESSRLGVMSPSVKGDKKIRRSSYIRRVCKLCELEYRKKYKERVKKDTQVVSDRQQRQNVS